MSDHEDISKDEETAVPDDGDDDIVDATSTDIEKQEEEKLKAKFPMVGRPMSGNSVFLQKRLATRGTTMQAVPPQRGVKVLQKDFQLPQECNDWTDVEKIQLLEALKKYGHLDMRNICESVPTKSKDQIRHLVNKAWQESQNVTVQKKKRGRKSKKFNNMSSQDIIPINEWIRLFEMARPTGCPVEIKTLPIAKSFLYISKFEKHPNPKECNGVNFRSLYEMLYRVFCGYPIKTLNAPSAQLVLQTLEELTEFSGNIKFEPQTKFLKNINSLSYNGSETFYDELLSQGIEDSLKILMNLNGYNPLNVPINLLNMDDIGIGMEHT